MIRTDGIIEIETPGFIISPKTTREDFLTSPLFIISKQSNQNVPWSRYTFSAISMGGEDFGGDILFSSGKLDSVGFWSRRIEFGSWSTNSIGQERGRDLFHKQLLETIFSRAPDEKVDLGTEKREFVYNFWWGLVAAGPDIKGGESSILVKYKEIF